MAKVPVDNVDEMTETEQFTLYGNVWNSLAALGASPGWEFDEWNDLSERQQLGFVIGLDHVDAATLLSRLMHAVEKL